MAGFAHPESSLAQQLTLPTTEPAPRAGRTLPNGPCNYRDASVGNCGCDQFWDKCSAELHDDSVEYRPSSERSTWCVCGHHACFHSRVPRAREPAGHANYDKQYQLAPRAQASFQQQPRQQSVSQAKGPACIGQSWDTPSQTSTTGLPGIPSVCKLSHDQNQVNNEVRHDGNPSRQTVTGLGLSMMQLESIRTAHRQQSPSPTIPDDVYESQAAQNVDREPEMISSRATSTQAGADRVTTPERAILDQVMEFNRNLHLNVPGDTIPNTYNPNDFLQSATEVATPSVRNTPDLGAADHAVQEGKKLIETLTRMTSSMHQPNGSPGKATSAASVPSPQLLLTNSPSPPQEQLQNLLRASSPQGVQKIISYLAPLHNLLNSIPNVSNTMRDLSTRLDMLENGSFNYVQPEELNQTLEMYEGRLIEVEHRVDEHDKLYQGNDDQTSGSLLSRRRLENPNASFGSVHSGHSTSSSTLILAAMDRKDTMEIDNIKGRLDILEAAALPTSANPWEVEVVLLPWGRDLRGIWFLPEEPMHDQSRATTQDSEEWTQAQVLRLEQSAQSSQSRAGEADSSTTSKAPLPRNRSMLRNAENGWSSQAISDWASGSAEEWLFPKACGSNNLVYKRLHSRGFIRNIMMTSSSSSDIQVSISHAYHDLSEHLSYSDPDGDSTVAAYPGLRASFIPLRKVLKESKLRYLTPAEMASSALWSAQFLAAGVMMRVSGGKKRLYVTHREAYMQQSNAVESSWSWQELRQLPRYQLDQDSPMEGNDDQCQPRVPEADAKEACWQFVESYDAPPASLHSSFASAQAVPISLPPVGRLGHRSTTPSSILKNKQVQPISPLSEFHPQRPRHVRNRTASASVLETFPPGSSKRRLNLSPVKQSSVPQDTSRAPSISLARPKRRRVAKSASPRAEENVAREVPAPIWTATPRRSREPPSPFYSSTPGLPRTNSDLASRPSQRSAAIVGRTTPFAYATPHSGPFIAGPGDSRFSYGGDTEPDDDDDGEQSWRGVTDGDEEGTTSNSASDVKPGEEEAGVFSGEDSGFGSESEDDEGQSDEESPFDTRDLHEDDDADDVLDSLLDVLEN